MDVASLVARMADIRLMDLDDGQIILKRLSDAIGGDTSVFSLDMSGNQIKEKYDTLPGTLKKNLDDLVVLDSEQAIEFIRDIEKIHGNTELLAQKNDAVIEAYLSNIVWLAILAIVTTIVLYSCSTADVSGSHSGFVEDAVKNLVENIYDKEMEKRAGNDATPTPPADESSPPQ